MKKLLTILFFSVAFTAFAATTPTILDATPLETGVTAAGTDTSITYAYNSPAGGSNRLLVNAIGWGCGFKPNTITYGGTRMSTTTRLVGTQQGDGILSYLPNPSSGNANIVVNWSPAAGCTLNATTFTLQDASQSTALDGILDVAGTHAATAGASTLSKAIVTSTNGDFVLSWIILSGGTAVAAQSPFTDLGSASGGFAQFDAGYNYQTTAASITAQFNWNTNATGDMFDEAILFVAPPAAATPPNFGTITNFE